MNEYQYVPLGNNVTEMFIGPFGSSLKNECFVNRDKAFCMVYEQRHAIQKTMDIETRYVDEQKYNELKRFNVQSGDIIVSCRGTIGETFIVPKNAPLGIMHPSIMKIRLKDGVYDKYYFNLLLKTRLNKHKAEANGSGVKMAISATELSKEIFPVPTMTEQLEITSIISKTYDIIEKRKKELQSLDILTKARFVEMFGDIILNNRLWKTDSWNNLLRIVNGKNQKAVESADGGYVICGSGGIMGKATDYLTNENSVIIGRKGNINKPILMREKYWNVDTAFGLEPNKNHICVEYLYMFCLFFDFNRLDKAVTIPSLTKADLLNIEMPVPDLETQKRFATFVSQVGKSKVVVQKALDETQVLFDSLMQKYFG